MSQPRKKVLLNAFNMNCVGHIHHGMWTHPQDRSTEFTSLKYWLDLAKTLERGLFDGLFIADILGVYDVYQQGIALTAKESIQLPVNDPLMLVSAMASVTEHLGFGVTANLSYEAPYPFARRFSTLDHLTDGRVGWNIVTGYLDSAARAMGQTELLSHDRRYDQADEFLDVSYQLWEEAGKTMRSWPTSSVACTPTAVKFIRFTIGASFIRLRDTTFRRLHRSARRCCFRRAARRAACSLPPGTPNAPSSAAVRRRQRGRRWTSCARPHRTRAEIPTASRSLWAFR